MARISLDPPRTLSYRFAARFSRRRYGAVLDPVAAVAHNARVGLAYGLFELQVERWRTLDRGLKDLAVMVAAATIGCSWCMDFGYWESVMQHDVPAEKIRAVPQWRDSGAFTELERLVLEYAEAMTATPPSVTDEMTDRLRASPQPGAAGRADRDRGGGEPAVADQRRARAHGPGLQGQVRDSGGRCRGRHRCRSCRHCRRPGGWRQCLRRATRLT